MFPSKIVITHNTPDLTLHYKKSAYMCHGLSKNWKWGELTNLNDEMDYQKNWMLNWKIGCVVMAWDVKNDGGEDSMGVGYGQRSEHGVHKWWPFDGSRSLHQDSILERSRRDVRRWSVCDRWSWLLGGRPHVCLRRHLILRSLFVLQSCHQYSSWCPHSCSQIDSFCPFHAPKVCSFQTLMNQATSSSCF